MRLPTSRFFVVGLVVLAHGTACDKAKVMTVDTGIEFVFPLDSYTLGPDSDINRTEPGVQINVEARVLGMANGDRLVLTNNVTVDSTGAPEQTSGTVQNDTVRFPGYTVPQSPAGLTTLRIATPDTGPGDTCVSSKCDEVRVTVIESECQFNYPADSSTLTAADEPAKYDTGAFGDPFEIDVLVDCRGGSAGDEVTLSVNGHPVLEALLDVTGRATFSRVVLEEGRNDLEATPETSGGAASAAVTLSTGNCIARMSPIDGTQLLASDDDNRDSDDGMQAVLSLITDCADTPQPTIRLWVQGPGDSTYSEVTLSPPGGVFPTTADLLGTRFELGAIDLPEANDFGVSVVAEVEEAGGAREGTTIPTRYAVDSIPPALSQAWPDDGECIAPLQDLYSAVPGVQIDASGFVDGVEIWAHAYNSSTPEIACTADSGCTAPMVCRDLVCRTVAEVAAGIFVLNQIEMPAGATTLEYVVLDAAGNRVVVEKDINVFDTAPSLTITSPASGASLGVADDLDTGTPGLQTDVTVALTEVPDGATGTLLISGQSSVGFTPVAGASTTEVVRVTLNDGNRQLTAQVDDACGNILSSTPISVTVVSDVQEIQVAASLADNSVCDGRTEVECGEAAECTWNATGGQTACVASAGSRTPLSDGTIVGGGVTQIDLDVVIDLGVEIAGNRTVSISRWTGADADGCTGTETPLASFTVLYEEVGALITDLALVAGTNCFAVTSADSINTLSTHFVVTQKADVPAVAITDPTTTPLDALANDSNSSLPGFNYTVQVTLTGGAGTGGAHDVAGTLVLQLDDDDASQMEVAANVATLNFVDVSLPTGGFELRAVFTDLYGNTATSAVVPVTVNSTAPQVAITAPQSGDSLGLGADVDAGISGVQFDVTVVQQGAATVTGCDLIIDDTTDVSGAAIGTISSTVADLADGDHQVRVECTDGISVGVSQTVTIEIDTSAPGQPTLVNEPEGTEGRLVFDSSPAYVNSYVSDSSAQPGLQHQVSVQAPTGGEDPVGWVVELTVTPPSASPTTYTHTVATAADPILVSWDAVDFGSVEESAQIQFSAVVTDRAGNGSSPATATLDIDRVVPVLTQVTPPPARLTLNRTDDQNVNLEYVDVAFEYEVEGATGDVTLHIVDANPDNDPPTLDLTLTADAGTDGAFQTLTFSQVAFDDGSYTAIATAEDAAGNIAEVEYAFSVLQLEAFIDWAGPTTGGLLNASNDTSTASGFQGTFAFNAVAFEPSTTEFRLCSNLQPAGVTATCKWGSDGTEGGPDAGWVVATGTLQGSEDSSSVFLSNVFLEEGAQTLHGEATDAGLDPDIPSEFLAFTVDSMPPVIESIVFNDNGTANDPSGYLVLNGTEGTPSGEQLTTSVTVTVSGSEEGRTVELLSDHPTEDTVVGSGALDSGQTVTINAALSEGLQTVRAQVTDVNGNPNQPATDVVASVDVAVDVTPGTAVVPAAQNSPYTSAHGVVSGTRMAIDIVVSVSDNESLEGATLRLDQFAADTGGTARETATETLTAGQTLVTYAGFSLDQGLNYLEATFTDAAGNVVSSASREAYPADFLGPDLTIAVEDAAASPLTCDDMTPCEVDYLDPAANSYFAVLDEDGSDTYIETPDGTTILFSLTGCDNSDTSIEDCSSTSTITVRLESRITTSGPEYYPVSDSTYAEEADVAIPTAYSTRAPAYRLGAGTVRAVRVAATDLNGNVSYSDPVYLVLNIDGVLVTVERLDAAAQSTGEELADDTYWGIAENVSGGVGFEANLRVSVTELGSLTVGPTDVDLTINSDPASNQALTGNQTDYLNVALLTSPTPSDLNPNTIDVVVNCGAGNPCGGVTFQDVIADIDPPTYEFNRCDLCALGVPLVDPDLCSTCDSVAGNADANIQDPGTAVAEWNAAGDQDATPSNGFSILTSGTPLRVQLNGVENGETVRLESNQGGLSVNSVSSTGCEPVTDCRATFGALNVPSLAGTLMHDITVSFTDRAGNAATPVTGRGDETIYARTDVLAPADVQPIVCIGESTTPVGVDPPSSDPKTYEDPSCTTACAASGAECDRRGGAATLTWVAPDEDGGSGGEVAGYEIVVAALAVRYPDSSGTDYTSCSAVDVDGDVEQRISVATAAEPGQAESATIVGLYPHRSYCFATLAIDDVGNRAEFGTSVVERTIPLVDYPDIVAFDPVNQDDDAAGAMYTAPDTGLFLGHQLTAVGDLDGDTLEDFAASRVNFGGTDPSTAVSVFLSGDGLDEPAVTVSAPTVAGAGGGRFGFSVAGGDFDNDGRSDLAICCEGLNTTVTGQPNSGANAGAVFLYYGVADTGIRRDVNASTSWLPSPFPDVALFGPAEARICGKALIDDVDGNAGAELLVGTTIQGQVCDSDGLNCAIDPKVYGFYGGSRDRFSGSPPATIQIHLDLSSPANCGSADCADFSLSRRSDGNAASFPWAMATADVNGDGVNDLAVSDHLADHSDTVCAACGEVYVYSGGAGLLGPVSPPNSEPAQLLHTLRYVDTGKNFGQTLLGVPAPRAPSDGADWLLVHAGAGIGRVVVFEATALGGTPGIVPADYPAGGLVEGASAYTLLDQTNWSGEAPGSFGNSMATLGAFDGHGGVDIAVGPGLVFTADPTFLYSFDSGVDGFVKRVIFIGSLNFGASCVGVSYLDAAVGGAAQIAISSPGQDAIHLFR